MVVEVICLFGLLRAFLPPALKDADFSNDRAAAHFILHFSAAHRKKEQLDTHGVVPSFEWQQWLL
jgi:hypothetical protein